MLELIYKSVIRYTNHPTMCYFQYMLLGYNWYTTDDLNNVVVISTGM